MCSREDAEERHSDAQQTDVADGRSYWDAGDYALEADCSNYREVAKEQREKRNRWTNMRVCAREGSAVSRTKEQFRYAFENTLSEQDSDDLWEPSFPDRGHFGDDRQRLT